MKLFYGYKIPDRGEGYPLHAVGAVNVGIIRHLPFAKFEDGRRQQRPDLREIVVQIANGILDIFHIRACLKIGDVSSSEGFWAAGKQFFRRNPGGFQGKTAPSRGQKTRWLGMLTFFKQALSLGP